MAAVFGIGGTLMLIGSLSLTSDLIGDNRVSSTLSTRSETIRDGIGGS